MTHSVNLQKPDPNKPEMTNDELRYRFALSIILQSIIKLF